MEETSGNELGVKSHKPHYRKNTKIEIIGNRAIPKNWQKYRKRIMKWVIENIRDCGITFCGGHTRMILTIFDNNPFTNEEIYKLVEYLRTVEKYILIHSNGAIPFNDGRAVQYYARK